MSAQRYGTGYFWTREREHLVLSGYSPAVEPAESGHGSEGLCPSAGALPARP